MRTVLDFHQGRARDDLLFTMSNNTRTTGRTRTGANLFKLLDEQRAQKCSAQIAAHGKAHVGQPKANHDRSGSAAADRRAPICKHRSGGARRDRTDDLLLAKQALSQLSYGPFRDQKSEVSNQKQNRKPSDY